jgi:2-polyprenyl-3-methyl-5-hydroxy-6-metoxy-1,4-benzoquinol methylase
MQKSALVYEVAVDLDNPNSAHTITLDMVGHSTRVLEFGCGPGHVTRALKERGCEVTGLEGDPVAAERAAEHAEQVLVTDFDVEDYTAKLVGEQYDVALFGDVLEHVREPVDLLRSVRPLLRRGGYVVISLPNIAHIDVRLALLRGKFEYKPWGLLDETHLRFFTRDSVEQLAREAGFRMVELRRVFVPAFDSEIDLDRGVFDPALVAEVLADPESETYQFVARLVFDDGDAFVASLGERCVALEGQLHHAVRQTELAVARAAEAQQRVAEVELRAAEAELRAVEAEERADDACEHLRLVYATKVMRYSNSARNVYGRWRGRQRSGA